MRKKILNWLDKAFFDVSSWFMLLLAFAVLTIPLIVVCLIAAIVKLAGDLARIIARRSAPARNAIGRWVGRNLRRAILFAVPAVARTRAWFGQRFFFQCLLVSLVPLWLTGLIAVITLALLNIITPALGLAFSLIFSLLLCTGWRGSTKTQEKVNDREMARKRRIAIGIVSRELKKLEEDLRITDTESLFKNVLIHAPAVFEELLCAHDEASDFSAEEIETITAHFAKNAEVVAAEVVAGKTADYFNNLKTGIDQERDILDLAAESANFYEKWLKAAQVKEGLAKEEANRLHRLLTDTNPDWMVVPAGVTLRVGYGPKPNLEKIRAMLARFAPEIIARGHNPADCNHCNIILDCPFLDELLNLEQSEQQSG